MGDKIAFIFPGQGSQHIGMCSDILKEYVDACSLMEKADRELDIDLKEICLKGPEEVLNNTRNTQPAVYTVSMILNKILVKEGIRPDMLAGHSLGEYTALAAAGVYSFTEGLKLVRQRGIIMEEAVPGGKGAMAAVIGLNKENIIDICSSVDGICEIANYNSPQQIVISGEDKALDDAVEKLKIAGAKKVVKLDVSGPFHSSLMKTARINLSEIINSINFQDPKIDFIANVSAKHEDNPLEIKKKLIDQMTGAVKWVDTIELMIAGGINTFVEVGPGRVLKGLVRRIDRSVKVYNVANLKSLNRVLEKCT